MAYYSSITREDLHHFHQVAIRSVEVRSHLDALVWLQGDMQQYLPHNILIAAWGDFAQGTVQHDVISAMVGVRSQNINPATLTPLTLRMYKRWVEFGKKPFTMRAGAEGFLLRDVGLECALGDALQTMRSAVVHGICDERGSHDCLYVSFSTNEEITEGERGAMSILLPYIDTALRQVAHLPHQEYVRIHPAKPVNPADAQFSTEHVLSQREIEILQWVTLGKTNPEIGSILEISAFTVKNHLQRLFKKLEVSNRAQAVGKFKTLMRNV